MTPIPAACTVVRGQVPGPRKQHARQIGPGSRVEHYEMAGYLTAISFAKKIGASEVVILLKASLAEEKAADKKLRTIASSLMKAAAAG